MGGAKAHYDCIKAFSETDFTEDLKTIDVPVLVMHGDDDQIVPIADSAPLSVKLLKNGTLKTYQGLPHGMCTTHPEVINPDLLALHQGLTSGARLRMAPSNRIRPRRRRPQEQVVASIASTAFFSSGSVTSTLAAARSVLTSAK